MNAEVLLRWFAAIVLPVTLAWDIYRRKRAEARGDGEQGRPRYGAYLDAALLPMYFCMLTPILLLMAGAEATAHALLSVGFDVFFQTGLYFAVLLMALPLLRRYISARVCATLWLLPNYLYIVQGVNMQLPRRPWVLHVPWIGADTLVAVWGIGFAAVLLRKIVSHFVFRAKILDGAREVEDREIRKIWVQERRAAGIEEEGMELVMSPHVRTPLSIGFFRRTIRVVLPEREYSPEELELIFRHEIVHISRKDSTAKFFLTFCTAMCWFNPLMWLAMRRSAEDLELSCDETVLLEADGDTRYRYAELLLRTAGDERGFTTCLSATAQSLRYRLKNVVNPGKRFVGGAVAGLILSVLILTSGHGALALAYGEITWEEAVFGGQGADAFSVKSVQRLEDAEYKDYECDEEALHTYLSGLTFHRVTGYYSFSSENREWITVRYRGPDGALSVTLMEDVLEVFSFQRTPYNMTYYHNGEIDWDYLYSLLSAMPEGDLP